MSRNGLGSLGPISFSAIAPRLVSASFPTEPSFRMRSTCCAISRSTGPWLAHPASAIATTSAIERYPEIDLTDNADPPTWCVSPVFDRTDLVSSHLTTHALRTRAVHLPQRGKGDTMGFEWLCIAVVAVFWGAYPLIARLSDLGGPVGSL